MAFSERLMNAQTAWRGNSYNCTLQQVHCKRGSQTSDMYFIVDFVRSTNNSISNAMRVAFNSIAEWRMACVVVVFQLRRGCIAA